MPNSKNSLDILCRVQHEFSGHKPPGNVAFLIAPSAAFETHGFAALIRTTKNLCRVLVGHTDGNLGIAFGSQFAASGK